MAGSVQGSHSEQRRMEERLEPSVLQRLSTIREKYGKIKQKYKEWKFCGKWLRSGVIHYSDPTGKERVYETVERTTRSEASTIDGVDLITLVVPPVISDSASKSSSGDKRICLVVAYRAPVDSFCVEFPSGLVDLNESLQHAAERELAEETGYHGNIKFFSSEVCCDPWKSNERSAMGIAEVTCTEDKADLKLDADEYLDTIELPLRGLRNQLDILQKDYDLVIDAKLYCLAVGLEMQTNLLR